MQTRYVRRPGLSTILVGIIVLTLAACNVDSDVPTSSAITETDEELVSLIWNSPYSVTQKAEVELDRAIQENPDMSLEEQTALLKQLLNEQLDGLSEGELAPLQYPWNVLTPAETRLCTKSPPACNKTRNYAEEARFYSEQREPIGKRRGPQDAHRHAYWNSAMCSRISYSWARNFANAHESESPNNTETEMDYYNNNIGRRICSDYKIALTMSRAIDAGDLRIVRGGPNGRLVRSNQPWP